MFDLTEWESFDNLPWWMSDVSKHTTDETVKIVLANKADEIKDWEVSKWEIKEFE